jgi:patatin-like phospholipase/acyl hydrolase
MRILSLSGGGIRGIFQAVFLRDLARQTNRPLHECFDLVAGTSTGAILALGVALNIDFEKIVTLFEDEGPRIFPKHIQKKARRTLSALGKGPFYDAGVLQQALSSAFRIKGRNARIKDCQTRIIIPATTLDKYEMRSFSNINHCDAPHGLDDNLFAVDVALASAAAPSFFRSHQPRGLDAFHDVTLEERTYIDGGLWANNPVLFAVMTAKRRLGIPFDDMSILSVGNGRIPEGAPGFDFDAMRRGLMLRSVLDIMFATQAQLAEETAGALVGDEGFSGSRMLIVNPDLPGKIDLDDVGSAVTILKPRAESELRNNLGLIKVLCSIN